MTRRTAATSILLLVICFAIAGALHAPAVAGVSHPGKLKYGELKFEIPKADAYRHTLSNGMVVYIAEDHTLPLVNVQVFVRAGAFLDPASRT